MKKIGAILWSEAGKDLEGPLDGCSTRRRAILALAEKHCELNLLELMTRGGLRDGASQLARLRRFLSESSELESLILFYPDFPLFHPPRLIKLPILKLILSNLENFRRRSGCKIHLDIVDLPRWQAPCLGYELRMASSVLRLAEERIFACADRITIPSESLASLIEDDFDLSKNKLKVVPNGLPVVLFDCRPEPAEGKPSFVYAGDLSTGLSRGTSQIVDLFLEKASPGAILHLCGEGGQWLSDSAYDKSVCHWGHLSEDECLKLVASCDFALIPYPETDYYRWCFPSKLGLYLAAGTVILSSSIDETVRVIDDLKVGETLPLAEFGRFFSEAEALATRWSDIDVGARSKGFHWEDKAVSAFDFLS